jgi:hypothetical protein
MPTLNPNKTGIIFGTMLVTWHAIWVAFIALGWAQAIIDFVLWIHMIKPVYVIGPFNILIALILIAVTGAFGYAGGFVLATLWNWLHREPLHVATQRVEGLAPAPR